jgi:hypothetical protein
MKRCSLLILFAALLTGSAFTAHAEDWPSLEQFASNCVLVVKARQAGDFSTNDGSILSFEVIETWKGRFDPRDFTELTPQGYIRAAQGEHGVHVIAGQEIIFFFTRHNQPPSKLRSHNAAFPIQNGRVVYASTGNPGVRQEMSLDEFKQFFEKFRAKP